MDAYNTDVRPLLAELREEMGLAPDPYKAYLASGYGEKIIAERVGRRRRRLGSVTDVTDNSYLTPADEAVAALLARSNRLGTRPEEHELRGRQRLRQGHGNRPGHRAADGTAVGEGLGR